jgi:hypothetical protein
VVYGIIAINPPISPLSSPKIIAADATNNDITRTRTTVRGGILDAESSMLN